MLSFQREGTSGPLLIQLHWLGGGAQTWREVNHGLAARGVQCAALDLPGFGESASVGGFTIQAMADHVVETIHAIRPEFAFGQPWVIAGHSMGGTVAALVARRALNGEPGLEGLRGLILVSASPPGPEPMPDAKRNDMLSTLGQPSGDARQDRKYAAKFVDDNTGKLPLPEAVRDRAIDGVLGMNRTAFRAWLEHGSNEDWRPHVGQIPLPALVFAGTEDGALGPDAQRTQTLPHFPKGQLITLEATGHLAPLERPGEVVEHITQFLAANGLELATPQQHPGPATANLMQSENTSPKTLDVMDSRLARSLSWNASSKVFSPAELRTLRALAEAIVPEAGFELAMCIDAHLYGNRGDGWRYAILPTDQEAWHRGLFSLDIAARQAHGVAFVALFPDQQRTLLEQAGNAKLGKGLLGTLHLTDAADAYTAEEMKTWFGDVRAEFTRLYMGDPRTMDRIGYTGFADEHGFTQIELGQQERFER